MRPKYHVPKELWEPAKAGMNAVLARMNLQFSNPEPLIGSSALAVLSKRDYVKHYRGLRLFCCYIGDYESLLMLQDNAPRPFCPSISASTISEFIRWKRTASGKPFLNRNREPIMDVLGRPMFCNGGWNDPRNVLQFNSAVIALHSSHNQRGQYLERCIECVNLERSGSGHLGCQFHRGNPCIWRKGCPVDSGDVENAVKQSSKDGETYEPNGDSPLSPFELIQIRNYLISSNTIENFQLWVLMLISYPKNSDRFDYGEL
jgi:hypothetical protein